MSNEIINQDSEIIDISDIKDEERIDFNYPKTILEYCSEEIQEINKVMTESSQLIGEDSYDSGVNTRVEKLDINKLMADNDKKKDKALKRIKRIDSNIVLRGADKIFHLKDKVDDSIMTASEIKREYDENIDAVVADMRKDADNMMRNIQINEDINEKVKPILDKMRRKLALGDADKQYFIDNFITPLEQKQERTEDEERDLALAKALVTECETSLTELAAGYEAIKQSLFEGQIHNSTDRRELITLGRFFNSTVGILKIKSKSIADTYAQKERVERHKKVFDIINQTYEDSSKDLANNVKMVVDMSEETILKPEVIQAVDKNLAKCTEILTAATEHKRSRNDSVQAVIKLVDEHLVSYHEALRKYDAVQASDQHNFKVDVEHPKQKTLKPNNNK